jgi:enoyl-CoA hydratase
MQATDLRVAADHARFGLQEVKWAIIPAGGSLVRLPRQMRSKAMEILLTGNLIDAQEAYRLGLLNYVVPAAKVIAKKELAAAIAANGPIAVRAIKQGAGRRSYLR